jgi:5S rRNA maturation endonuclease (ribonuclease M5)
MNDTSIIYAELLYQSYDVIEDIFDELKVHFRKTLKGYQGICPIHGGDNPTALMIYLYDGIEICNWVCFTRHCEKKYGKNLIGFIRGVLSHQKGRDISYMDATRWLLKFLKYESLSDIELPSKDMVARRAYSQLQNRTLLLPKKTKTDWTRDRVRARLEIPPEYYLSRGYSKKILDKYDVGWYNELQRVVVPVYDEAYSCAVGFTARSPFDKCEGCGSYHHPHNGCVYVPKWRNSKGFDISHHLYNYWFSKPYIQRNMSIIITEGPGDVWKLEEAGIYNSVAIFGTSLSDQQLFLLEQSGAMSAIIILDQDEAGILGMREIQKYLSRFMRLYFPTINTNDIGDLDTDVITDEIRPLLGQIEKVYK